MVFGKTQCHQAADIMVDLLFVCDRTDLNSINSRTGGFGFLVRKSRRAGNRQTQLLNSLMSRMTDTLQSVKSLKSMGLDPQGDAPPLRQCDGYSWKRREGKRAGSGLFRRVTHQSTNSRCRSKSMTSCFTAPWAR